MEPVDRLKLRDALNRITAGGDGAEDLNTIISAESEWTLVGSERAGRHHLH